MNRSTEFPRPAILEGGPGDRTRVPVSQPTLPDFEGYCAPLREIFETRQLTNSRWVGELEARAAEYLQCREVVAMGNATAGLVLTAKVLGLRGKVALPTFTFPATLHALLWNGLEPVLLDCDPETFNLDPQSLEEAIIRQGVTGVVPVYIFGNSPDWAALRPMIESHGLRSYSDAAHALGTKWDGVMAGNFADVEIYSLAPTKVTVAGEGGLLAMNDRELAGELRVARNYGNPGDYDCRLAGLNARLSELHALLAYQSLAATESAIETRHRLVERYKAGLEGVPGVGFQRIDARCRSTYNYIALRIHGETFGLTNAELHDALAGDRIESKIYFAPPLHRQSRFTAYFEGQGPFPGTESVLSEVLCIPLYTHMEEDTVDRVIACIRGCQAHAEEVRATLRARDAGPRVLRIVTELTGRDVTREQHGQQDLESLGIGEVQRLQLLSDLETGFGFKVDGDAPQAPRFESLDAVIRFVEDQLRPGGARR